VDFAVATAAVLGEWADLVEEVAVAVGPVAAVASVAGVLVEIGDEQKIPNWLCRYLQVGDLSLISKAVSEAEAKTTGEIVPMVVERSSTVGHVPLALSLVLFSALLLLDLNVQWETSAGTWGVLITPFLAVACYGIALILGRFWTIQRILTSNFDEAHQVSVRAELEFHRGAFENTQKRTGILIFISMMERRVVVLADQGLSSRLPPETWQAMVDKLVQSLKRKDLRGGLIEAIASCGALLADKFPAQGHENNELANDLIIKP
jgi:putative membrane protein